MRFLEAPTSPGAGMTERGRRQWKEGADYVCEGGWLVRSNTTWALTLAANTKARFTRAVDGTLIIERREEAGGVVIVVPMYVSTGRWFRYTQVAP